MLVAIASGKGGTGKTLVSTSLAWLLAGHGTHVTYVDVDVEEPNGHLFLHPDISTRARFTRPVPRLARDTCSGCGDCQRSCRFNAILALPDKVLVFDELCSSCGGCVLACEEEALVEIPREVGTVEMGVALANGDRSLRFASATLDVGEARATPLIGGLLDTIEDEGVVIVDAPPGTSCSVMEVVKRVDQVILVTEPTPFGLHDLRLAVEMTRAFGKPLAAVINRSDLGDDKTRRYLQRQSIECVAEIPHLTEVAAAYARGELAAQASEQFRQLIEPLAKRIRQRVAS